MTVAKSLTLGSFLRTKRKQQLVESIDEHWVTRGYRRVPGLRREELAHLAGVSISWYTLLEQDRAKSSPSPQVLSSLARALKLSPAEQIHLFDLAQQRAPQPNSDEERITPQLQRMLEQQIWPTYVVNRYWDIVGWNNAAVVVFVDYTKLPLLERNVLFQLFVNPASQQIMMNWESYAKSLLGPLRTDYGRYREDSLFEDLIERLSRTSIEFSSWWPQHDITACEQQETIVQHPDLGRLSLEPTVYSVEHASGLRLVLYTPLDEQTHNQLTQL